MALLAITSVMVLLATWYATARSKVSGRLFIATWIGLVMILAALGYHTHNSNMECTRLASAVFSTSPVLLSGPALLVLRFNPSHYSLMLSMLIAAIAPVVAWLTSLFSLGSYGHVWGF